MTVLAFDVGGTHLRGALVDGAGTIRERRRRPTPHADAPALIAAIVEEGRALAATAPDGPLAVGLAIAGFLDRPVGAVRASPGIGLRDAQLAAPLRDGLALPVVLVNDVNAAAFAEAAHAGADDLAAVFVGTGVGTGFVTGGTLVEGHRGMAGEGGHLVFRRGGEPCPVGCEGCFEAYLGGSALAARARSAGVADDTSGLVAAWRAGGPEATALMEDAALAMEALACLIVNTFDPARIVVGGGVARACPELLDAARRGVAANPLGDGRRDVPVEPAALGEDAGLLGAARLAALRQGAVPSGR